VPTIKFTVPRRGLTDGSAKVLIESEGYSGEQCIAGTSKLLKTMGAVVSREETPDMYREANNDVAVSGN
jgi:hypothetical protein